MPEGVGSRALLSSSYSSSSSSSILVLQQWGGFDFADRPQEGILSRRDQVMVATRLSSPKSRQFTALKLSLDVCIVKIMLRRSKIFIVIHARIAISSVGATSRYDRAEAQCALKTSTNRTRPSLGGARLSGATNHRKRRGIPYMALLRSYGVNL